MSLKAIAQQELARLKAGEMVHETERETEAKHVKQPVSCFIDASDRFAGMKRPERQKTAVNEPCFTVAFPRAETRETSVPRGVASGLSRLKLMRAPRLMRPEAWPVTLSDAERLARDGWAAKALAFGWSPLNLFRAVIDLRGDPSSDGLAVWLSGRKLLALCASFAVADAGNGGRAYFNRRDAEGAVLLWEIQK